MMFKCSKGSFNFIYLFTSLQSPDYSQLTNNKKRISEWLDQPFTDFRVEIAAYPSRSFLHLRFVVVLLCRDIGQSGVQGHLLWLAIVVGIICWLRA